ncbi:alpha/beta hydrolase family protein [Massilia sp. TWR1-2-2]|uniref:alpha/beta hydrolase family protein n=1 Tax=Massilia sp. TWR1-2-2 TaxID=2804584 RepID=UPI003CF96C98
MGRQEPLRFKARDGLEIPGLLTLPPGGIKKNLPMVVLVHGGPWMRGSTWGWNPDTQFLATRGYAILEVEFLGTTGLGVRHCEAGFKQWGIQQAARIRQPLLLAYGSEDTRVPLHHGKKFYSAVTRTNNNVEFAAYSGEGHGWSLPKNRIDFWRRVEKFLDNNTGPSSVGAAVVVPEGKPSI